MNNSPVTSACLHHSPQRLAQVSDGGAPPSQRSSVRGGSSEKRDTRCLKNVTLALKNCSSLDGWIYSSFFFLEWLIRRSGGYASMQRNTINRAKVHCTTTDRCYPRPEQNKTTTTKKAFCRHVNGFSESLKPAECVSPNEWEDIFSPRRSHFSFRDQRNKPKKTNNNTSRKKWSLPTWVPSVSKWRPL